jgi:hypothetical protein
MRQSGSVSLCLPDNFQQTRKEWSNAIPGGNNLTGNRGTGVCAG